jgi:hypothetical protein
VVPNLLVLADGVVAPAGGAAGVAAVSATTLIDRLERVRQTAPGRWLAKCPAHQDRSPSLSIRELDDGRVLLHDFGGCQVGDVLAAVGLTLTDLFPQRLPGHAHAPTHSKIPARDLLQIMSQEVSVVAIVAADLIAKKTITETDWQRLALAASRIGKATDYVR